MPGRPAGPVATSLQLPPVDEVRREGDHRVTLRLRVPADDHGLQDHFPGFPIVPGMLLVAWTVALASKYFDVGTFTGVPAAKFRWPLRPGDEAFVALEWQPGARKLRYSYRLRDLECARGTVEFARDV